MKSFVPAAALVLAGTLLVACSGDERLTEAEFLEQGNKICATGGEKIQAAAEAAFSDVAEGATPDPAQLDRFYDDFVPAVEEQIDGLDALVPPEDMESDVDEMLDFARSSLDTVKNEGSQIFLTAQDPFAEANEKAGEIGLTECAG